MMRKILALLLALPVVALPLTANAAITHRFTGAAANDLADGVVEPSIGSAEGLTLGGDTDSGDLVVCAVAQRSATDYTTISASGYTVLFGEDRADGPSVAILGKIAGASEAVPTITSTDKTNARTLIAQCAVFSGAQATLDGIVAHQAFDNDGASQASIETPALAISTDNTVAIMIAAKNNDFNAEDPALPFISGCTASECELGEAQRTPSAQIGMVWGFEIQTTATNIASGSVSLTENPTKGTTIAVSLKPAAVTPLYTSDPAIQTRTTSSLVFRATTDTTGTRWGARLTDGSAAPTCDQLEAQTATGGVQYGSQAATATVASDLTLSGITDGTVTDYYECLEDGSGNDSAVKSIADVYKTPAWTSAPVVSAQSDTAYTIAKDLDGAGSTYAVACAKDSTAPTYAQVAAGNCTGDEAAIAAASGDGTSATLALGSGLTRPIHDIYVVGTYGSQQSAVTTLADEMLDAPAGYQYDMLESISATSPCQELNDIPISPTIAAADVTKWSTTTSPSGYAFTAGTDCETQYTDPSGSRQTATIAVYDTSAGDWMSGGPTTIYFNNTAPTCTISNCEYNTGDSLINGVAMDSVAMANWFSDADTGDSLTITYSGDLPTSTSIDGSGNWTGTPSCASGDTAGAFATTATDEAGDTETVDVTWTCYDQVAVPDCAGETLTACLALMGDENLDVVATFRCDASADALDVLSQTPENPTVVDPFSTVALTVSSGRCNRPFPRLWLNTRLGL